MKYWRDRFLNQITDEDVFFAMSASSEHLSSQEILKQKIKLITEKVDSDIEQEIQTILIQRYYDAITKNRITDKSPHFIGTWDLKLEPKGLFELFIDSVKKSGNGTCLISGTIEDCLGTATFEGCLSPKKIEFTKKYIPGKSSSTLEERINYFGFFDDREINGTYSTGNIYPHSVKGNFKMKQIKEIV